MQDKLANSTRDISDYENELIRLMLDNDYTEGLPNTHNRIRHHKGKMQRMLNSMDPTEQVVIVGHSETFKALTGKRFDYCEFHCIDNLYNHD